MMSTILGGDYAMLGDKEFKNITGRNPTHEDYKLLYRQAQKAYLAGSRSKENEIASRLK